MDFHVINEWTIAVVTAFVVLLFWAYRSIVARQAATDKALSDLALHVAEEYVSVKRFEAYSNRFDEVAKVIFEKLDNVRDKLDKKADKPQ